MIPTDDGGEMKSHNPSFHRKRNNRSAKPSELFCDSSNVEMDQSSRRITNQRASNGNSSSKKTNIGARSPRSEPSRRTSSRSIPYVMIFLLIILVLTTSWASTFVKWTGGLKQTNSTTTKMKPTSSRVKKTKKGKRHLPRIAYMERTWTSKDRVNHQNRTRIIEIEPNSMGDNDNEWQEPKESQGGKCIPKSVWQTASNPSCNNIHEIDFATAVVKEIIGGAVQNVSHSTEDDLKLLGEGWFRTTWQLDRSIVTNEANETHQNNRHHHSQHHQTSTIQIESVVLKTLRIERDFLSEYYELHRRDAVAMERLTGSHFVVDVFGFCAQSAINELADFNYHGINNLESFNRRLRGMNTPKTAAMKIRLAASIALGVADIHAAGENRMDSAFMVHYDLNPRNIALFSGGRPKINDFNIAEFLRYDPETGESCGFPSRLHEPWWRAPEEMNVNATNEGILLDEKVDLYALGNILYHTLTSYAPWGKMKNARIPEIRPKVANGEHPQIPKIYMHDKSPQIKAIVTAIKMCWVKDPNERASAREVAKILYSVLSEGKEAAPELLYPTQPARVEGEEP